jgi:hypothetical protein
MSGLSCVLYLSGERIMVRVILNRGFDGKFKRSQKRLEQYGQIYGQNDGRRPCSFLL